MESLNFWYIVDEKYTEYPARMVSILFSMVIMTFSIHFEQVFTWSSVVQLLRTCLQIRNLRFSSQKNSIDDKGSVLNLLISFFQFRVYHVEEVLTKVF